MSMIPDDLPEGLSVQEQIEWHRFYLERDRAYLEGQLAFANNAIRHLILINGGAAIAVLAFLGHVSGSGGTVSANVQTLSLAMILFGLGVFAGGICALLAYIFQTVVRETRGRPLLKASLRLTAIGVAIAGLVLFLSGLLLAACAFSSA